MDYLLNQLKQNLKNYFSLLKNDRFELTIFGGILFLAIYLTFKFIGAYDSTSGYDIRGEFCGYLLQLGFLAFLYINFRAKDSAEFKKLKPLSLTVVLLTITNFLIIKSLSTFFPFLMLVLFLSIMLFLILVTAITRS